MLVANWYPQANRRRTQVETSKLYWCRLPVDEHIDTISRSASTAYSITVYGALRCIAGRPFGHLDGLDLLAAFASDLVWSALGEERSHIQTSLVRVLLESPPTPSGLTST